MLILTASGLGASHLLVNDSSGFVFVWKDFSFLPLIHMSSHIILELFNNLACLPMVPFDSFRPPIPE
jgi:hypothetical protein